METRCLFRGQKIECCKIAQCFNKINILSFSDLICPDQGLQHKEQPCWRKQMEHGF
ncbi:uncharacterized protein J3R85_020221 [Psidium guajava]|nr:uncharacterized protein J3R85_020221 [Psidium guajava]